MTARAYSVNWYGRVALSLGERQALATAFCISCGTWACACWVTAPASSSIAAASLSKRLSFHTQQDFQMLRPHVC